MLAAQLPAAAAPGAKPQYIVKGFNSARGEDIALVSSAADVAALPRDRPAVAQAYVADPLLVLGRKFHLRVYLVIASLEPLRVHLFREGLVRAGVGLLPATAFNHPLSVACRCSLPGRRTTRRPATSPRTSPTPPSRRTPASRGCSRSSGGTCGAWATTWMRAFGARYYWLVAARLTEFFSPLCYA